MIDPTQTLTGARQQPSVADSFFHAETSTVQPLPWSQASGSRIVVFGKWLRQGTARQAPWGKVKF